jgi:PBP1b-binding outer membrane lipoprotein LpoB
MKGMLAIVSAMMLVFVLVACNSQPTESTTPTEEAATTTEADMGADPMATEPVDSMEPIEGAEAAPAEGEGGMEEEAAEEPAM